MADRALDPEGAANNGSVKGGRTPADHVLTAAVGRGLKDGVDPERERKAVTAAAGVE